ncbi:hypothetical protein KB206_10020 [Microvirga sp. STS02]|uniref:hypothetical protein n=1 Tax=Hymenobacter negativus TaxID=2795026 RepID=UPI0018DC1480|nr:MULTISPECIES: hypothetical protein [Bacteria]MBH8569220.1 hypothetical protein [Hymenobacter negativus]MBR7208955.1 hypothetical protein [Microvirga sp. STS02]
MADNQLTSESNGFRMGVITAAVLAAYTGIAAAAGFLGKIEAGTLDIVILAAGVVLAIRRLKQAKGRRMSYFQGFSTGIITALSASVLLGAFFWLLGGISQAAVRQIQARDLFGADLGVLIGGLGIILLGTMTGVITALIAMQYFKASEHQAIAGIE